MLKTAIEIIQAQNALKEVYGEEGYQQLLAAVQKTVDAIKQKAPKLPTMLILSGLAKDENYCSEARLAFFAAMGEME